MVELTWVHWTLLIVSAIIIGFSKTGITGMTLPAVAMIAYTFGSKASSGVMLTMLIAGDLLAVAHYRKEVKLSVIMKVLLPAVIGIILGAFIGNYLNDNQFKLLMGGIVVVCLALLLYREIAKKSFEVSNNRMFHYGAGITSGFSSMVGNAAGPIFSVYMLSLPFNKIKFIGTTAWFFFAVNLIKVPFHVFLWGTISLETMKYTLYMLPFILLGAALGVQFVKKINEKHFKFAVIIMTAISAMRLIL